jgi:hypothetical protein
MGYAIPSLKAPPRLIKVDRYREEESYLNAVTVVYANVFCDKEYHVEGSRLHPDHQLGINRWAAGHAVERRQMLPQPSEINEMVDCPQPCGRQEGRNGDCTKLLNWPCSPR